MFTRKLGCGALAGSVGLGALVMDVSAQKNDGTLRMIGTDLEGLEQIQPAFGAYRDLFTATLGMIVPYLYDDPYQYRESW